jgi:hypothetical protein
MNAKLKKMLRQIFTLLFFTAFSTGLFAKEGMWIPTLLQKYNIEEMSQMGFKLSSEDVYSVNHASMKDAVVLFGNGCTGGVISGDGLMITNHHCGFGQIQEHSSVQHDYLTDGFWAMNRSEELTNQGLTVQFLVRMEDITDKILINVTDKMNQVALRDTIQKNIEKVKTQYLKGTDYSADVKPLFNGNQYFIYIYEVFKDIRLVGAPPVSIGKFGGDTDNWIWPRHTGDFSLFRIYAGKDNKPAVYSPKNVPYKPKKFFPINLKGLKEGDFTMVFGYPGTTQRYVPSQAVNLIMNQSDPAKVAIRTVKLNIWAQRMKSDPKIRIQYADKYVSASNSWKKWQGEAKGLERLDAVNVKKAGEAEFKKWVMSDPQRFQKYGTILSDFEKLYSEYLPYQAANDYITECIQRGSDIFMLAAKFESIEKAKDAEQLKKETEKLRDYLVVYFKDYDQKTDELILSALMKIYVTKVDQKFMPQQLVRLIPSIMKEDYTTKIYGKSILTDSLKINKLLKNFNQKSIKRLEKDPVYSLFIMIRQHYRDNEDIVFRSIYSDIASVQKKYTAAIMEMNAGQRLMADANLTLRIAYGKIEGYKPSDAVTYNCFTTLKGIIQKDNPEIADYNVPQSLLKLYNARDFGQYVNESGEVPVAFCASNHTTGGNSGSPVVNAQGELIGLNFDRSWEGTMSDIIYDPDQCRNIALDMRYALFIIDKFAGAGYLLSEMQIVK